MTWFHILKTDEIEPFMELGDDHQQILTDMIERLANKAIEEELSKRNSRMEDLSEEEFQTLLTRILDKIAPSVTEEYKAYLRNVQSKNQEENR